MTEEPEDCPGCPSCMGPPDPMAWQLYTTADPNMDTPGHAIPDNDTGKHLFDLEGACPCRPYIDDQADDLIFVHRAFDRREEYAQQLRKLN